MVRGFPAFAVLSGAAILAIAGCAVDDRVLHLADAASGGVGAGSGGAAGTGGVLGTGGAGPVPEPIVGTPLATFDSDIQGFTLDLGNGDAAETNVAASTFIPLTWDPSEGSPAPGALKVTIPFTDFNQYITIGKYFELDALQDWSNRTLHVRIMITSGHNIDPNAPMIANTFVQSFVSGATDPYPVAGRGGPVQETDSGWQEFTVNAASANYVQAGWDPTKVFHFGVQLKSGYTSLSPAKPTTAVVYFDSFSLE